MSLITYPPEKHQTDSKSIFFIGSAQEYCRINKDQVQLADNGNFAHLVKLKLGSNKFSIDLDGEILTREVIGVKPEEPNPVAYARHYDAFPAQNPSKRNVLRSILVSESRIEIPLNIAPIYQLEKQGKYKAYLDLQDTDMDLDWIYYQGEHCPIIVGEVIRSRVPIIFTKAVASIEENWTDNSLVLDIKYYDQEFSVCIDPGHGGEQFGTCSPKGIFEKDLNLSFAKLLNQELHNLGINSQLTRDEDDTTSLDERVNFAEENDSLLFLSIHHNALPDGRDPNLESGLSTHYYHEQSKPFARYLLSKLSEHSELACYGMFRQNLHVLRENHSRISVLLELGYLIHPIESELISSHEFQAKHARIVAKAIQNHFNIEKN